MEKKNSVLQIRLQSSLLQKLRKVKNYSQFVREALVEKLEAAHDQQ